MRKSKPIIAAERNTMSYKEIEQPVSSYFGSNTFNVRVMKAKLPKDVYKKLTEIIEKNKIA